MNSQKTSIGKGRPILRTKELNTEELKRYQRIATRKFYLRPKQVIRILKKIETIHQLMLLADLIKGFFKINPKPYEGEEGVKKEIDRFYHNSKNIIS